MGFYPAGNGNVSGGFCVDAMRPTMHHIPARILKAELAGLKRPLSEPHGYSLSRVSVTLAHEYLLPLTTSICYP